MKAELRTLVPARLVVPLAVVALLSEGLAWGLLVGELGLPWFGRPELLVAVHALTLGTLAAALVGVGWQLLPVVTTQALHPVCARLARAINLAFVLGLPALLWGLGHGGGAAHLGGGLVIGALSLRALLVLVELGRASGRRVLRAWLAAAELSLLAGVLLGGALLSARLGHPLLDDHLGGIGRHASVLLGGWLGGWILGLAGVLLPMFAVAAEPRPAGMALGGLLFFGGLWSGVGPLVALGSAGLSALLLIGLRSRLRRRLGAGLVGASLALLGLALSGGLSLVDPALAVTAGLGLFALPMLRGVSLRIGPFLIWAHLFGDRPSRGPEVESLTAAAPAWVGVLAGLAAGALALLATWRQLPALGDLAAALGLVGLILHAVTLGVAAFRAWRHTLRSQALPGLEEA